MKYDMYLAREWRQSGSATVVGDKSRQAPNRFRKATRLKLVQNLHGGGWLVRTGGDRDKAVALFNWRIDSRCNQCKGG